MNRNGKETIPGDLKVSQDERLSKKHIQTLGYVQELMKENKKLVKLVEEYEQQKLHCDDLHAQNEAAQEKIKKMQEQYMSRADEINAILVQKHETEQMKLKEDKLRAEKELADRTREMTLEIERLQKVNSSLEEALQAKSKLAFSQLELNNENEAYKEKIDALQNRVDSLTRSNNNQLSEIKKLNDNIERNKELKTQLSTAQQTIIELENKIRKLNSDLVDSQSLLTAVKENDLQSYKDKLIKALNEVASLQGQVHQKEFDLEAAKNKIRDLMDELEAVQTNRYKLEREKEALTKENEELRAQIVRLKSKDKSSETGSFKDFVALKRELATLHDENQKLKDKLTSNAVRTSSAIKTNKQRITLKLT